MPCRWLAAQAEVGDCVLLSPACASLDMYQNYAHRAQVFIDAVQGLHAMMIGAARRLARRQVAGDRPRPAVERADPAVRRPGLGCIRPPSPLPRAAVRPVISLPTTWSARRVSCASAWSPAAVAFQVPLQALAGATRLYLFMAGVVLLALVLIPGIGRDVNGARRWISLGFANLQPSELMKLFAVLYAADYTVRKINVMHDLKQAFLPMFGAMAVVGGLLLKEPDFGAFVVIISIAMGILFLGGLNARPVRHAASSACSSPSRS